MTGHDLGVLMEGAGTGLAAGGLLMMGLGLLLLNAVCMFLNLAERVITRQFPEGQP